MSNSSAHAAPPRMIEKFDGCQEEMLVRDMGRRRNRVGLLMALLKCQVMTRGWHRWG